MAIRLHIVTRPGFTVAVAVLALNDHMLKATVLGRVTGKLSDVAGVAVVVMCLGVVISRLRAVVVAAACFLVLKTIPEVSVAIAPILGGTTYADPSDLIALAVLVPVYVWLGRDLPIQAPDSAKEGDVLAIAHRV